MKKVIITAIILAFIVCATTIYCRAIGNGTVSENASMEQTLSEQSPINVKGKALVVYFSVPETDGVDASSGASRIVSDGQVMGNTQYIASVISEAKPNVLNWLKKIGF